MLDFGPEKLAGLSRNGPLARVLARVLARILASLRGRRSKGKGKGIRDNARGRREEGLSRGEIAPSPSPFKACHAGYSNPGFNVSLYRLSNDDSDGNENGKK